MFSDTQNVTITGKYRSTQPDNYTHQTYIYTTKQFSGDDGIRLTVDAAIRKSIFTGLSGGALRTGAKAVQYGIRVDDAPSWSPTSNGADSGNFPYNEDDQISLT
jgi:hypothetical protein